MSQFMKIVLQAEDFTSLGLGSNLASLSSQEVAARVITAIQAITAGSKNGAMLVSDLTSGARPVGSVVGDTVQAGDTFTIMGVVSTADTDFAVGADDAETMLNLYNFLDGTSLGEVVELAIDDVTITITPKVYTAFFGALDGTGGLTVSGAFFADGAPPSVLATINVGENLDANVLLG